MCVLPSYGQWKGFLMLFFFLHLWNFMRGFRRGNKKHVMDDFSVYFAVGIQGVRRVKQPSCKPAVGDNTLSLISSYLFAWTRNRCNQREPQIHPQLFSSFVIWCDQTNWKAGSGFEKRKISFWNGRWWIRLDLTLKWQLSSSLFMTLCHNKTRIKPA